MLNYLIAVAFDDICITIMCHNPFTIHTIYCLYCILTHPYYLIRAKLVVPNRSLKSVLMWPYKRAAELDIPEALKFVC